MRRAAKSSSSSSHRSGSGSKSSSSGSRSKSSSGGGACLQVTLHDLAAQQRQLLLQQRQAGGVQCTADRTGGGVRRGACAQRTIGLTLSATHAMLSFQLSLEHHAIK